MEPTALAHGDDALTNGATRQGPSPLFPFLSSLLSLSSLWIRGSEVLFRPFSLASLVQGRQVRIQMRL